MSRFRRPRLPIRVGTLTTFSLAVGVTLLLMAGVLAGTQGQFILGIAAAGLAAVATGLGIDAHRMMSRITVLASLEEVDRFALQAIAGDATVHARQLERLARTGERASRAGLTVRLLDSALPAPLDPSLLAGILALAPQQVVLVADDSTAEAYTNALSDLSPSTVVLRLPEEQHLGAFFDRLAAKRRTSGAPVPVIAATTTAALRTVASGPAGAHLLERFGVSEFLVLSPPGIRAGLETPPRDSPVRSTALGSLGLLISRAAAPPSA